MKAFFVDQIRVAITVKEAFLESEKLINDLIGIATMCVERLRAGGKILIAGNGGSAADAQHFAAELIGKFYINRPSLPAIALTTDTSIITATGNDFSFDYIFSRQIEGLGKEGDVFIGISTSGNSKNIVEAMSKAKEKKIITVGLTGEVTGQMDILCDYLLKVPSKETPRIQEVHLLIEHLICDAIEKTLFGLC